jgi:hypothetical protein
VPEALQYFSVPEGFFDQENNFVAKLEDLGLVNQSTKVAEFMCAPGLNAKSLSSKVKEYTGFDSSKVSLRLLQSLMPEHKFCTFDELKSETYDLIILASREGRWSKVSVENLIHLASKFLALNGSIVVELPYPDTHITSPDLKVKLVTLHRKQAFDGTLAIQS